MNILVMTFRELDLNELYGLLQLRAEVFVVEQNCAYQDIDGKDKSALHILGYENDKLVAYARCFPPEFYFKEAAIGRVLIRKNSRNKAFGHEIIKASINAIEDVYHTKRIKLSAQQYLTDFYESHGFMKIGEGYLEDGIPHIAMIRKG